MRVPILMLMASLFVGCVSTKEIGASWSDPSVRSAVSRIGLLGSGVVSFRTPADLEHTRETTGRISSATDFYALEGDSIHWANLPLEPISRSDVVSVRWAAPGRDRREGAKKGAIIGGVGGLAAGLLTGLSMTGECEGFLDFWCGASAGDVAIVSLGFAASGSLVYGLTGAAIGTKKQTIYRFRPDTPQQMSVVIGVGPSIDQNGGAR